MKQLLFVFAYALLASSVSAQSQPTSEIVTQGSAKLKVKADIASFRFSIDKRDIVESKAIAQLNQEVNKLIVVLNGLGFKNTDIKVSDYDINSSHSNYTYNNDTEPKVYTARNTLTLSFRLNTKTIDAIYQAIEKEQMADTDVSFEAKLSDSLSRITRSRLIQLAIDDAKSKASDIALGLGQKLGKVKSVNHDHRVYVYDLYDQARSVEGNYNFGLSATTSYAKLDPEEIELDDNVTIVFELVK